MGPFDPTLMALATETLALLRATGMKVVTAESCTGGLIAALLTEIPGSSDVVERGYVTYSNQAKIECLGVPPEAIASHGAVSAVVAEAMARGALRNSHADIAVAVTGVAGPGGGSAAKPVGLVHVALAARGRDTVVLKELRFGDIGRGAVRLETVRVALTVLADAKTRGVVPEARFAAPPSPSPKASPPA